jgi:hypothetical protein
MGSQVARIRPRVQRMRRASTAIRRERVRRWRVVGDMGMVLAPKPHPSPLPAYRERG